MGDRSNQSEEKKIDNTLIHRNIPKLTLAEKKDTTEEKVVKKETQEERVARISSVKLSFADFCRDCIDYDYLKLFTFLSLGFCFVVGVITILYLLFLYFFRTRLFYYYFPTEEQLRLAKQQHSEL